MSILCADGRPAQIPAWAPLPPSHRKGDPMPYERDRCTRCGLLSVYHRLTSESEDAMREILQAVRR